MFRLVDGEINMFRQVDIGRWRDKYVQIGRYRYVDGERYMFRLVDGGGGGKTVVPDVVTGRDRLASYPPPPKLFPRGGKLDRRPDKQIVFRAENFRRFEGYRSFKL